jgi:hypothetical protein
MENRNMSLITLFMPQSGSGAVLGFYSMYKNGIEMEFYATDPSYYATAVCE